MAETLRLYGPAALAWAFVLFQLSRTRPGPAEPSRRLVWSFLLGLAFSQTVNTPVVYTAIGAGVPNLARLLGHGGMLVVAWSVAAFFWQLADPGPRSRSRSKRYRWWLAGGFTLMAVLFALAPTPIDDVRFAARYAHAPWVLEYWLVYLLAVAFGLLPAIGLGLQCARAAATAAIRLGMRLVITATVCALAYALHKTAFFTTVRFDLPYPEAIQRRLDELLPLAAAVLALTGTTLPSWAAHLRLAELAAWLAAYRTYQRLRPLWFALYRVLPEIALVPAAPALIDRLYPRHLRLRLYRRIIEIRDARLALLPYFNPHLTASTRELAEHRGVTGRALDILVEVTGLTAAIHARSTGHTPGQSHAPVTVPGGADLNSDTAFLTDVAAAYHRRRPHH